MVRLNRTPTAPTAARRRAGAVASLLLLAFAAGCAVNPATGRREFTLVSADQELAIGRDGYAATLAEYGRYDDERLAAYVDSVGQKLARVSELPNLEWHFTVLDDPVVNAFAMPGGYIYITRGILAHLNSEAQLAGVLGHEIGHVTARHSAKHLTQQQLAGLGLGLAGALSETFARYGGAAQQALGLLMLKYSRDDETQADALGIRYASAAGWDVRQVPLTYAMLKRISTRGGSALPFYLSTHPDPGDREARTSALAAQAVAGRSGLIVRHREYLDHVRGIEFGADPRQGYFEAGRFYQPTMGFEMTFPAGWTTQNGRSVVAAAEPQQHAMMQLSAAPNAGTLAPEDYVAALRRDGRIAAAEGRDDGPDGLAGWIGHVSVPNGAGGAAVLFAAWVRGPDGALLQFLGQSAVVGDADDVKMSDAVRSLRRLGDPRRASPLPQRLRIAANPASGSFSAVIAKLGPGALPLEDTAILNGVENEASIGAGESIKFVEPGRLR